MAIGGGERQVDGSCEGVSSKESKDSTEFGGNMKRSEERDGGCDGKGSEIVPQGVSGGSEGGMECVWVCSAKEGNELALMVIEENFDDCNVEFEESGRGGSRELEKIPGEID